MTSKRKNKNKNKANRSRSLDFTTDHPSETTKQGNVSAPLSPAHYQISSADFLCLNTSTPSNPEMINDSKQNVVTDSSNDSLTAHVDMDLIGTEEEVDKSTTSNPDPSLVDNNSLLAALQSQSDVNFQNMHSMVHATISGAIHQLKTELKTEFKAALDKNHKDFLALKQATTEQLSRVEIKVTGNLSEMNIRINSLGDKLLNLEKTMSSTNIAAIDESLAKNVLQVSTLTNHLTALKKKVDSYESAQSDLQQSIAFMNKQYEEIKSLQATKDTKIERLGRRLDNSDICQTRLGSKVDKLETKEATSDIKHRKYNLVFDGVPEAANENVYGLIANIFNSSNGLADPSSIDTAYRLGKPNANHIRPILVAFYSIAAKDQVLRNAAKIKYVTNRPNMWINRDHPDITRRQSNNARKCYNLMKQNNHKCVLQGTSITYDAKVYHYKDLNKLPEGSRLEDTRMIPCNNGQGICFQGDLSYLSNLYKAPLYFRNKYFEHSEQAFQWCKATVSGDNEKANRILALDNPFEIKQLEDEVKPKDQWTLSEIDTLRDITVAKFSQNRALGERLRNSPYTSYYECTRNTYWGTGYQLPTSTREIDHTKFEGENQFGLILRDVKAKLINDVQRAAAAADAKTTTTPTPNQKASPAKTNTGQ